MGSQDAGMTGALENINQRHSNDATPKAAQDEAIGLLLARHNMPGDHAYSAADQATMKKYGLPSAEELLGPASKLEAGAGPVDVPGHPKVKISEGANDSEGRPVSIVHDASDPEHLSTTYVDSQGNAQSFVTGKDGHGVTVTGRDGKPHSYGAGSSIDRDPATGTPKIGADGIPVIKTDDHREIKVKADGTSESKDKDGIVTTADNTGHIKNIKWPNGESRDISPEASKALTPMEGKPGFFSFNGHEIKGDMTPDGQGGMKFKDDSGRDVAVSKAGVVAISQGGETREYWSADHQYSLCYRSGDNGDQWYAHRENSSKYIQVPAPAVNPQTGVVESSLPSGAKFAIGGETDPTIAGPTNGWRRVGM